MTQYDKASDLKKMNEDAMFEYIQETPAVLQGLLDHRKEYTKEFVDASSHFSLSVLGEEHRKALNYFGTVSGRDEDKIAKSGLKLCYQEDVPCFQDANTVFLCRKLYAQPLKPECFTDAADDAKWYPEKDYHTMYIAEIEGIYMK